MSVQLEYAHRPDGQYVLSVYNGTRRVGRFVSDPDDPAQREYACAQIQNLLPGLPADEIRHRLLEAAPSALSTVRPSTSEVGKDSGPRERNASRRWPKPLEVEAFHGLAGEFVRVVEPHSEADPAALLVQFLVSFGSVIGRTAYAVVEDARHYCNINATLVGETAKARKGTSWGRVHPLFRRHFEQWASVCVVKGLSSGEGLIFQVRDEGDRGGDDGDARGQHRARGGDDEAAEDKRCLVVEAEFAAVLKVLKREGNILSTVIRDAWDTGELRTLTKNTPVKASGAHISILGHITAEELIRTMNQTEAANGFGNRFLWVCARRSKSLPDGGELPADQLDQLGVQLRGAVEFAVAQGEIRRDADAKTLWHAVYQTLSEGRPGMLGSMTARAEAQVLRLSVIYALLDQCSQVQEVHLRAALALWRYCEASAAHVFGDSLGDPVADEILSALRDKPEGMTRTEVRDLFHRNRPASAINGALDSLERFGLAQRQTVPTGGRNAERWVALTTKATETTEPPATTTAEHDRSFPSSLSYVEGGRDGVERTETEECQAGLSSGTRP